MADDLTLEKPMTKLAMFWWAFAARGGVAILFAAVLFYAGGFFGTIFFDPIMLVVLAMMLGFYVLSNGVLLGVASCYAAQHQVGIWRLLLAECIFATALGTYIGFSLLLSSESLAWLAGLHALGTGCFLTALGMKLLANKRYGFTLLSAGVLSIGAGLGFLLHRNAAARNATHWLAAFELFYGIVILVFAVGLHKHHVPVISSTAPARETA
jgi:uncharacterized membrane protein HdeD (DUF308 family)